MQVSDFSQYTISMTIKRHNSTATDRQYQEMDDTQQDVCKIKIAKQIYEYNKLHSKFVSGIHRWQIDDTMLTAAEFNNKFKTEQFAAAYAQYL